MGMGGLVGTEALEAAAALISINLVLVEEGISISSSVALEERLILAHSLLDVASTDSISIIDGRAVEAGWTLALVPTDAVAKWQSTVPMLYTQTTSDATNVDMCTIDGIVQIPRRASTGGT